MNIKQHTVKTTCKFCRREFQSFGFEKVCSECDSAMEKRFQLIKEYLNEFPDATVNDVCDNLNVPTALVKYYLKEERLEIKKNSNNLFLTCNKCGKPINTGRYCFECEVQVLRAGMKSVYIENEDEKEMENVIARYHARLNTKSKNV